MQTLQPTIIAETNDWIAVNKPSGMLSIQDRHQHELPSAKSWLDSKYGEVLIVHRIDRDTSGLLLFARHAAAHQRLSKAFEQRQVEKKYLGIVLGTPPQTSGSIDAPMAEHPVKKGTMVVHAKGKPALTHYQVQQSFGKYSLVMFEIETGRTHQIRVHAKQMGHPIAADPIYTDGKPVRLSDFKKKVQLGKYETEERPLLQRLGLHAWQLAFTEADGTRVQLEAPLHKDMRALLQQLEKNTR